MVFLRTPNGADDLDIFRSGFPYDLYISLVMQNNGIRTPRAVCEAMINATRH